MILKMEIITLKYSSVNFYQHIVTLISSPPLPFDSHFPSESGFTSSPWFTAPPVAEENRWG